MRAFARTVIARKHDVDAKRRRNRWCRHAVGIALLSAFLTACDPQSATVANDVERPAYSVEDPIPFLGTWTREFEVGPGSPHVATYVVAPDRVHYKLVGNVGNADYVVIRDGFSASDNRFFGHTTDGEFYVLFARDVSDQSVTIHKQKVDGLTAASELAVPPIDTTESHGWNTYEKRQNASVPD